MRTLILGQGLLGTEINKQTEWTTVSRKKHGFDFTNPDTYLQYILMFDQIVNCVGYTNTWSDEKEPAWTVNYKAVIDLVDMCNKYEKKLVHISTDYIYANSGYHAKETDVPVHFNNWYTYSKLLADGYVQAKSNDYLLIRASFKPRPYPWDNAWTNLWGNFDYVDTIAGKIIALINKNASGVYNVGTEVKTMYELARRTSDCNRQERDSLLNDITMNLDKQNELLSDNDL